MGSIEFELLQDSDGFAGDKELVSGLYLLQFSADEGYEYLLLNYDALRNQWRTNDDDCEIVDLAGFDEECIEACLVISH